jgi:hypothetical protein
VTAAAGKPAASDKKQEPSVFDFAIPILVANDMTQYLIMAGFALGGYLLRHLNVFGAGKTATPVPAPIPPAPPAASTPQSVLLSMIGDALHSQTASLLASGVEQLLASKMAGKVGMPANTLAALLAGAGQDLSSLIPQTKAASAAAAPPAAAPVSGGASVQLPLPGMAVHATIKPA